MTPDFDRPLGEAFEDFRTETVARLDSVLKKYKDCYRAYYAINGAKSSQLVRGRYLLEMIRLLEKHRAQVLNWPIYSFDAWADRFTTTSISELPD